MLLPFSHSRHLSFLSPSFYKYSNPTSNTFTDEISCDCRVLRMSRAMKSVWEFVYVAFAVMAMISAEAYAAISCMTVISDLAPCAAFVSGADAEPAKACCDGIRSLNSAASTTDDRKATCKCIKSFIGGAPVNYTRAAELPKRCGVDIDIPISPSVDCNK